ncbi:MAG: aminotransferase class I/II-fold pyridoxal phosphate-dependent enzyme [Proteobacteria bacterium]|nr:aminotransferase class I/II-fold pyridoxal phosphate-dependent enzyme [Pseudomonadota bacterium]MBU1710388.1 aminotransferase class I/II-fold pyridoxal phosphate-dependent enzyme [Pseudomonadota bacterium]
MNSATKTITSHGGDIIATARQLGCRIDELIDMSSNLTPFGMAPGLREALIDRLDEIAFLPEIGSETLCRFFDEKYGLNGCRVFAGSGTTEFIFAIPAAFQSKKAVIVNPTYSDYLLACKWAGVQTIRFDLKPEENFVLDLGRLRKSLTGGELVFLCNPNNPTGVLTASAQLHECISSHPDTMFVVDESYLPFTSEPSLLKFSVPDNLLLLRSFSKIYGMPGLRLGFLITSETNAPAMMNRRKPWEVNRMAQIAGEFLLQKADEYIQDVQRFIASEVKIFVEGLSVLPDIEVVPGAANFILSRLNGPISASVLRERMLDKKIMIRNCDNFTGLDHRYFRVSLKDQENNKVCRNALQEILGNR